jgi:hypothetical protein
VGKLTAPFRSKSLFSVESDETGMKFQWPNLRHYHSILLEERRKTRIIFSGSAKAERFGKSTFRIKFRRVAVPSSMFFFNWTCCNREQHKLMKSYAVEKV